MPQTKQAEKSLRQDKKRALRNTKIRANIEILLKKTRRAISSKADNAQELLRQIAKQIDKAAQKGVIKKNTASRIKSRLMLSWNKSQKA